MALPTRLVRVQDADYNTIHELVDARGYDSMGDVITDALRRLVADLDCDEDEEDCPEYDEDETF